MRHITTLIALAFAPCLSYAFFCPTNLNQIDFGDTTDQVTAQCGKPDKEEKKDLEPLVPQEWSFLVPQTVAMSANQEGQGTLKTSVIFDKDGKAINLTVNGIGVGASTICGKPIQLGDTMDAIKSACGEPAFINKQQPQAVNQAVKAETTKIVIYTYNTSPPVQLTFENGLLKSKE